MRELPRVRQPGISYTSRPASRRTSGSQRSLATPASIRLRPPCRRRTSALPQDFSPTPGQEPDKGGTEGEGGCSKRATRKSQPLGGVWRVLVRVLVHPCDPHDPPSTPWNPPPGKSPGFHHHE